MLLARGYFGPYWGQTYLLDLHQVVSDQDKSSHKQQVSRPDQQSCQRSWGTTSFLQGSQRWLCHGQRAVCRREVPVRVSEWSLRFTQHLSVISGTDRCCVLAWDWGSALGPGSSTCCTAVWSTVPQKNSSSIPVTALIMQKCVCPYSPALLPTTPFCLPCVWVSGAGVFYACVSSEPRVSTLHIQDEHMDLNIEFSEAEGAWGVFDVFLLLIRLLVLRDNSPCLISVYISQAMAGTW